MPAGLLAAAAIPAAGGLAVRVADTLTAAEARHAAVAVVRAARRNGWQASQTAAIIPVLAAAAGWHAAAISVRAAIVTGVTVATATAAGVAIAVLPGHPVVPLFRVGPLPAPAAHAHYHVTARKSARHLIAASAPVTTGPDVSPSRVRAPQPQGSAKPGRSTSARVPPSGSPSTQPTTSAAAPSSTPSPSPSASATPGVCLGVLILNICVPL
jgi:hypothetical protein